MHKYGKYSDLIVGSNKTTIWVEKFKEEKETNPDTQTHKLANEQTHSSPKFT